MAKISYIKIHPAIGIARVGNHPSEFFVGPEKPFDNSAPPGGYKTGDDGVLKVKRQAARFRLFAYDGTDTPIGEITGENATISWTVDLANKKASWEFFDGPHRNPGRLRNPDVALARRSELDIKPRARTIGADDRGPVAFDGGTFLSFNPSGPVEEAREVYLGELRTDSHGHLLVLGGRGMSESRSGTDITDYANNAGWYDDVADGPVDATVTLEHEGQQVSPPVRGAWVVCAPPNFAPPIQSVVSLYDMLYDRAVRSGVTKAPSRPSYAYDIYPLLAAALEVKNLYTDPFSSENYHRFTLSGSMPKNQRQDIFRRLRVPPTLRDPSNRPGSSNGNMPRLRDANDAYSFNGLFDEGFTVTATQYALLERWVKGKFNKDDEHGDPPVSAADITPDGLDRAALASCIGGAFFPGIEAGWFLESNSALQMDGEDFLRIDRTQPLFGKQLSAGDVTKVMAVPWQADFYKCTKYGPGQIDPAWWPAARPNEVRQANDTRAPWAEPDIGGHEDMVRRWWRLGFVVAGATGFEEQQRNLPAAGPDVT